MKCLITGAKGQLGNEWVDFLKNKGISYSSCSSNQLDITDYNAVEEKLREDKPDVIINCAAYTGVDKAESEKEKAFHVNEKGVGILAELAEELGAVFVHFSTDYVFAGNKKDREKYREGYDESAPKRPVNTYGESKRAGEVLLENSHKNWLLIRVSWLCGQYGSNFVKTMIRLGKEKAELQVVDDQIGSPTFTFDVVEKTWQLLQMQKRGGYHISSKGTISWADFAEEIFRITNIKTHIKRISTDEYPTAAQRPYYSKLSAKKIERAGIEPVYWKDGLMKLVNQLNS